MRQFPGTECEGRAPREHYVYGRSNWGNTTWGYCYDCGNIVTFIQYELSHATTISLWTDWHYPIVEWP